MCVERKTVTGREPYSGYFEKTHAALKILSNVDIKLSNAVKRNATKQHGGITVPSSQKISVLFKKIAAVFTTA